MKKTFYEEMEEDKDYQKKLNNLNPEKIENINFVNRNLRYSLRYYQEQSLFALQYFEGLDIDNVFKEELCEDIGDEKVPFYSFELATGAGKTLLMGAKILYLLCRGVKDFLIITPNTTIYEKTIQNFSLGHKRCVFSNDSLLKMNLVTGENYKDKTCEYEEDADFNIYIFNIQKFFEKGTEKGDELKRTPYTHRPLEESYWKDEEGSTVSFIEFLRNKKLAIITDEAHHYQAKESNRAISELKPSLVLEYTATALEKSKNKKEQKVIYKYSLRNLINDKYAKKIRALGYEDSGEKSSDEVNGKDKRKIILSLISHIVKKESLKKERVKPLNLIRARQGEHAKNVLECLQKGFEEEKEIVKEVLEVVKNERTPLTEHFMNYYKKTKYDLNKIIKDLNKIAKNSFRIDSDNKNEVEIIKQWDEIESNNIEIIVYKKMLDEGIDLDNIYLLTILSDTNNSIKTPVKQAVGRGVRLYKEKREFDEETKNLIKRQSELLYIICDKDKNFGKFIEQIREELGLSREELNEDVETELVSDSPLTKKLEDKSIKLIEITSDIKEGINLEKEFNGLERFHKDFIKKITTPKNGKNFISDEIRNILEEREVGVERQETLGKHIPSEKILELSEIERYSIIGELIESVDCIPDHKKIVEIFDNIIKKIIAEKIYFYQAIGNESLILKRVFRREFIKFFKIKTEDALFESSEITFTKSLTNIYTERQIQLEKDGYKNFAEFDENVDSSKISEKNIYFRGFDYSIYKYNKFDSRQEREFATKLDKIMKKEGVEKNFWVKNASKGEYEIKKDGLNNYNPDFIVYYNNQLYLIEVKGEGYLADFENSGNKRILGKLGNDPKNIKTILIMAKDISEKIPKMETFEDILTLNSLNK